MNIFDALSQGKSRLHETSMSAILGYLLNPRADHGLGDIFLRSFLKLLSERVEHHDFMKEVLTRRLIDADVKLEERYELVDRKTGEKIKDCNIDVQIIIPDVSY